MTIILGINAYHGDASAAIVCDGRLVAAMEEERFRRVKHWAGFPSEAIQACLDIANVRPANVDHFALGRDPRANLARKALFAVSRRPSVGLLRDRVANARRIGGIATEIASALSLPREHVQARLHFVEHHPAHLASAFFVSPFEQAAVCAIDGFGDFVSTSMALGTQHEIEILQRTYFPHSLGMLYLAVTQHLGFPNYGDEYKVMGLAPYGRPEHADRIRGLVRLQEGGRFKLDLSYFRHWREGAAMTWMGAPAQGPVFSEKLSELLGPARAPGEAVARKHEDIAASLQVVFEEAAFHVLNALQAKTGEHRLALAGGCAMNSVANGKIRQRTSFRELFVQPASADNGTSLGAAYHVWNQVLHSARAFQMTHSYWGPSYGRAAVEEALASAATELEALGCSRITFADEAELCHAVAADIASGRVVGWYQGPMEWGARALGNRSILGDPRRSDMREIINTRIKFRERFRPFAPSILEESLHEYFEGAVVDPFMIQVYPVREEKRAQIPAVTHVDGSGRLQTVSAASNPRYWHLIKSFEKVSAVPIILNTSFNENEPIVLTPEEALACFLRTHMDTIVLGETIIRRPRGGTAQ